jgi:hypothetical protein
MLLTYFVVDRQHQLRRVKRELIESIWNGETPAADIPYRVGDHFRIVSVLCDEEDLLPQMCFFVRAELKHGKVTDRSRFEAYEAMTVHQDRGDSTAGTNHQLSGWPTDWHIQLAVALDVPAVELRRIGVGGPLLMADLWGFSIERILEYFDEASEGSESDF